MLKMKENYFICKWKNNLLRQITTNFHHKTLNMRTILKAEFTEEFLIKLFPSTASIFITQHDVKIIFIKW